MEKKAEDKAKAEHDEKGERPLFGLSGTTLAIIAAVALLAVALIYYGAVQRQAPADEPGTLVAAIDSEASRLLLSSYDAAMDLPTFSLEYWTDEDGVRSQYRLMDNGTDRFAHVKGGFGEVSGHFTTGNASGDIACLTYGNQTKCAMAGDDSGVRGVADNIRGLFFTKSQRMEKKEFMKKLIENGAAKPSGAVVDEKAGPFDARKASYALSYKNVTVQQLISMGISPDDQSIYSIENYAMTFWVDKKTGLLVKSREEYDMDGDRHLFITEYGAISLAKPEIPEKPTALATPVEFVAFYGKSAQEYTGSEKCLALPKAEQNDCFKALAYERRDPEICEKIAEREQYEGCVLIIAQTTTRDLLCERLDALKDECYIAIVAETGNADLCKKVKDNSLIKSCADAVAAGERKMDAINQELLRAVSSMNCAADADCMVAGKFGEFCVPKNSTLLPVNEYGPFYSCYANLTCGCMQGYCGFSKNDSYYSCISQVEEGIFRSYIDTLIESKNSSSG